MELELLRSQVQELYNSLMECHTKERKAMSLYEHDPELVEASLAIIEKERFSLTKKYLKAEVALAKAEQKAAFEEELNPSVKVKFLEAAIKEHKRLTEQAKSVSPFDEALYKALNGLWTFDEARNS